MSLDPSAPPPSGTDERQALRIASLERRIRTLEAYIAGGGSQLPVVSALPTAGRKGRILFNAGDGKVYADTGSSWSALN